MSTGAGPAAYACAVLDDGSVVFGGSITLAGSSVVSRIARWDGSSWLPVGGGVDGFVRTVLANRDGGFVAGGQFFNAGGEPAGLIAEWDGSTWSALGGGLDAGSCRTLLRLSNGDLVAGGSFLQADDKPAWGIARWDGSVWSKLGTNTAGGGVSGYFWHEPRPTMVLDAVEMLNGDLIIGGDFRFADGVSADGLARWDGTTWSDVGGGTNDVVRALVVLPNGDLVAAGLFTSAGGVACNGLARWDGSAWSAIGDGLNGTSSSSPFDLAMTNDGKVILSGSFTVVDSVAANNVAIWDPSTNTWSAMGSGMVPSIQTRVYDVDVDANGVVYAGGQFSSAGGSPDAWNVARFECSPACQADFTGDGVLNFFDIESYLTAFSAQNPAADLTGDGSWNFFDVAAYIVAYQAGCR